MTTEHDDNDARLTEQVVASFASTPDVRLRTLMQSLVRHIHAFVRETEPSEVEWMCAIRFLTETGKMCDDLVRQEFILLSDTLGVSMLVDAINHRSATGATDTTVYGPFYIKGMPERAYGENMAFTPGAPVVVRGRVRNTDGILVTDAVLDVSQTADNGMYSGQDTAQPHGNLRGRYRTTQKGAVQSQRFCPLAIRFLRMARSAGCSTRQVGIEAPGHRTLVTHLFDKDDKYLQSDAVFGVKPSLMVAYRDRPANDELARRFKLNGPYREAHYDFALDRN